MAEALFPPDQCSGAEQCSLGADFLSTDRPKEGSCLCLEAGAVVLHLSTFSTWRDPGSVSSSGARAGSQLSSLS